MLVLTRSQKYLLCRTLYPHCRTTTVCTSSQNFSFFSLVNNTQRITVSNRITLYCHRHLCFSLLFETTACTWLFVVTCWLHTLQHRFLQAMEEIKYSSGRIKQERMSSVISLFVLPPHFANMRNLYDWQALFMSEVISTLMCEEADWA